MNKIWTYGLIIALLYGLITHQQQELFNLLFQVPKIAFQTTLVLCLNACFFNGLLNIAIKSGLIKQLTKYLNPFLNLFFKRESLKAKEYLSIHFLSLLFGLSALASISGLKAMKELQNTRPNTLSRAMIRLFLLNTTGISLFPSSVLALRQAFQDASLLFIPIAFLISCCTFLIGSLITNKIAHE